MSLAQQQPLPALLLLNRSFFSFHLIHNKAAATYISQFREQNASLYQVEVLSQLWLYGSSARKVLSQQLTLTQGLLNSTRDSERHRVCKQLHDLAVIYLEGYEYVKEVRGEKMVGMARSKGSHDSSPLIYHLLFAATPQAQGKERSAEFEEARRHVLGLFADNAANAMYALQVAERFRDYQALIMWCNRSNQPANLERYKAVRLAAA